MTGGPQAIGLDVGGTKIAAARVDADGAIHARTRVASPARDVKRTLMAVLDTARSMLTDEVGAVGIGAAGLVSSATGTLAFAPNLAWRDVGLAAHVSSALGLPVVVENDANAAAWGEARFGAGREKRFVVCVTVGTGVGGGIVVDGRLYRGGFGVGAEIGHIQMVEGGRPCGCGQRGCWEQYASGGALVRDARERAAHSRAEAEILLGLGDGTPEGISGEHVTAAAQQGDPVAKASFEALGHWLGQGLADLAAVLDPECFVLGGGVSEAGALVLDPTAAAFGHLLTGRGRRPTAQVVLAQLGNDAGLVGAADLARYR